MERMQKTYEDFEKELKKMRASEEKLNELLRYYLEDFLLFDLTGMAGTSDESLKKSIVRNARQKTVILLRGIKSVGVEKFDPEKPESFDADSEKMFEAFSDVNWNYDDDDED